MKKTTTTKPKIGARSCGACNACCSAFEINEIVQITKKVHALKPPAPAGMRPKDLEIVHPDGTVERVKARTAADLPVIGREPDGPPRALHKPKGVACELLNDDRAGCSIHDDRPKTCSSFYCGWLLGLGADDARPDRSGVIVTVRAPGIDRVDVSPMNEKHVGDARSRRLLAGGKIFAVVESKVGGLDSPRGRVIVEGLRRSAPTATFVYGNSDTPTLAGPPGWMKDVAAAIEALPPLYLVRSTVNDGDFVTSADVEGVLTWTTDEKKAARFERDRAHEIAAIAKAAVAVPA